MTHYTDADHGRLVRALCGRLVTNDAREVNLTTPTCPRCQQILDAREAEPLPAWAQAGLR
jgi:hypothetical protein